VDFIRQRAEVRLGDLGQPQRREIGVAQFEQLRTKREGAPLDPHVAKLDERLEDAARRGAIETGDASDVAQAEPGMIGVKGHDHGEAALQAPNKRLSRLIALVVLNSFDGIVFERFGRATGLTRRAHAPLALLSWSLISRPVWRGRVEASSRRWQMTPTTTIAILQESSSAQP
jgi:hypothetical protein